MVAKKDIQNAARAAKQRIPRFGDLADKFGDSDGDFDFNMDGLMKDIIWASIGRFAEQYSLTLPEDLVQACKEAFQEEFELLIEGWQSFFAERERSAALFSRCYGLQNQISYALREYSRTL